MSDENVCQTLWHSTCEGVLTCDKTRCKLCLASTTPGGKDILHVLKSKLCVPCQQLAFRMHLKC